MVVLNVTNQQEATDGEYLPHAPADQGRPGDAGSRRTGRAGLPRAEARVPQAEAGPADHDPPVRAAGAELQHGDQPPAAPGRDRVRPVRLLRGASTAAPAVAAAGAEAGGGGG